MRRIADQNDLASELVDAGDLAEYAAGIEYRLADIYAVPRALVDEHALAKRIQIHIHDVADDESRSDAGGAVAQCAQSAALGLERLVALQPELGDAQLVLEFGLVAAQRLARRETLAQPRPAFEGTGDRELHRVGDDRQSPADLAEVIVALVDDDQAEREQAEQHAAKQQTGRTTGSIRTTKCDHGYGFP